jgi:hypothetical protein
LEIIRKDADATCFDVLLHDLPKGTEKNNKNHRDDVGVLGGVRRTVTVRTCTPERPKKGGEFQYE